MAYRWKKITILRRKYTQAYAPNVSKVLMNNPRHAHGPMVQRQQSRPRCYSHAFTYRGVCAASALDELAPMLASWSPHCLGVSTYHAVTMHVFVSYILSAAVPPLPLDVRVIPTSPHSQRQGQYWHVPGRGNYGFGPASHPSLTQKSLFVANLWEWLAFVPWSNE
jgi:hypothetical protein